MGLMIKNGKRRKRETTLESLTANEKAHDPAETTNGSKEEIGGGGRPRGGVAAATAGENELCAMRGEK
jgi:hypothetical protein